MTQIDPQRYLTLLERAKTIACWDSEASGLNGDYNSILCVSIKRFGSKPVTFTVSRPGDDKRCVQEAAAYLNDLDAWVTYYGKGFDVPMMQARLLYHGLPPLASKPHIDMYFALRYRLKVARRSQGHLLSWLGTPDQKMGVPPGVWSQLLADPDRHMPTMVRRCESDTRGLESLYRRTRHLLRDVRA